MTGSRGIQFLIDSMDVADAARLRAALIGLSLGADGLSARKRREVENAAQRRLADERPTIVAESIDLLNRLGSTKMRGRIWKLRTHASPFVVGSVLRYMARQFPEEAVDLLKSHLRHSEPIVRQNAIDELDLLECLDALPAIKRLLKDPDKNVRQAARAAVGNLEQAKPGSNR
jgi:hypothetical protein